MPTRTQRRQFLSYFGALGLSSSLLPHVLWGQLQQQGGRPVTVDMLREAVAVSGLAFTRRELEAMLNGVNENLARYKDLHGQRIDNSIAPTLYFNPVLPGMSIDRAKGAIKISPLPTLTRPHDLEDVAFWPVLHLASLLQTMQV